MKVISDLEEERIGLLREQVYPENRGDVAVAPAPCAGFMCRQFAGPVTRRQRVFDVLFGVVLPVLCLVCDPTVFRGGVFDERPILGAFWLFAYLVSAFGIAALLVWLLFARRVGEWSAMLGGVLLACAFFSFVVGVVISPFSLIGLLVLVGALGFIPFFTAFVYLRNGVRAVRSAGLHLRGGRRALAVAFGAFLALAPPAYAHLKVSRVLGHALPVSAGGWWREIGSLND